MTSKTKKLVFKFILISIFFVGSLGSAFANPYSEGYVWDRNTEYSTSSNPGTDLNANLVWSYEWFADLNYLNTNLMTQVASWGPRWEYGPLNISGWDQNTNYNAGWNTNKITTLIRWTNPVGNNIPVYLQGGFRLWWGGSNSGVSGFFAAPVDVQVVLGYYDASENQANLLLDQFIASPITEEVACPTWGDCPNIYIPLNFSVFLGSGDSIFWTAIPLSQVNANRWITFNDNPMIISTPDESCPLNTKCFQFNENAGSVTAFDASGQLYGPVNNPDIAFLGDGYFNGDENQSTYIDITSDYTAFNEADTLTYEVRFRPTAVNLDWEDTNSDDIDDNIEEEFTFSRIFERNRAIRATILHADYAGTNFPAYADKAFIQVKYFTDEALRHTCPHPQWPDDPYVGNDARWHQINSDIDTHPIMDDHWYKMRVVFDSGDLVQPVYIYLDDQGTDGNGTGEQWAGYQNASQTKNESSTCKWGALPGDKITLEDQFISVGTHPNKNPIFLFKGQIDWLTWTNEAILSMFTPTLAWTGEADYVNDGVNPDSATDGSNFEFRVEYTDADNDPATTTELWLDRDDNGIYLADEVYDLTEVDSGDTDYTDGKIYTTTLALALTGDGNLNYRFNASDNWNTATGPPTSDNIVIVNPADYATTVGIATAVVANATSIDISMPYTDDINVNNSYTVKYKLSSAETWLDWGTNPKNNSNSPYTDSIISLTTGQSYDVQLTYNDEDGVNGDATQTITGLIPRGNIYFVCVSGGDFTTIQLAIDSSTDKDTVLVCDGVYTENLNISSKNIIIKSVNGAGATTLQPFNSAFNTIKFQDGTIGSQLIGLTITGASTQSGVMAWNANLTIEDCIISNNTSSGDGGGIHAKSNAIVTVNNTTFTGNQAARGGAIFINTGVTATISECSFSNNSVSNSGGAVQFNSVNTASTMSDSTIGPNNTATNGGGIYINNSQIDISRCDINNNSATYGGAVFVNGSATTSSEFINCLITDNNASSDGGAAYTNTDTSIYFTNCTINNNSATTRGGAFYIHSGFSSTSIYAYNTILWGNTSADGNIGYIKSATSSELTISDSVYEDNSSFTGSNSPTLTNNSTINPDLTVDYRLQATSVSALDKANATFAPSDDIDGDIRPQGTDDDIGADEFIIIPAPVDHYAITIGSATGVTCEAASVTITAHDADCALYEFTTGTTINISTSTGLGDWNKVAGGGSFVAGSANSGIASYTFPINTGVVELAYSTITSGAVDIDIADGEPKTEDPDEDPPITFSDTGFIFSTIINQIGGKSSNLAPNSSTLTIRAVETDTSTWECKTRITGIQTIQMAYDCQDPDTCITTNSVGIGPNAMTCTVANTPTGGADTTAINNFTDSPGSYSDVTLNFDPAYNGLATFAMIYCDVGQIRLHAKAVLSAVGNDPAITLLGTSNIFTSRPFGFDINVTELDDTPNPGATNYGDASFVTAGSDFKTSAQAVLWAADDDDPDGISDGIPDGHNDVDPSNNTSLGDNVIAPSFGSEQSAEQIVLNSVLDQPVGGTPSDLVGTTTISSLDNGGGSTTVRFNEVGIIEIAARVSDDNYLGIGSETDKMISRSGYVGRFIPDHFIITAVNNGIMQNSCDTMTYIGQDFTYGTGTPPTITVTPFDKSYTLALSNYINNFKKLQSTGFSFTYPLVDGDPLSPSIGAEGDSVTLFCVNEAGSLSSVSSPVSVYTFGQDSCNYTRNDNAIVAPFTSDIRISLTAVTDDDNVTANDLPILISPTGVQLRYGQGEASDSFGPENAPLMLRVGVDDYDGALWERNSNDSCTKISFSTTPHDGITIDTAPVAGEDISINNGEGILTLTNTNTTCGTVDVNYQFPAYLGNNISVEVISCIYRGNDRIINWQEIYR